MKNKNHKPMAWITVLIFLFSTFITPTSIVKADTPKIISASVAVDGVNEGGIIDSSADVNVTVSLPSIPVIGDGVDEFFVYNDQIELLISEHFKFDSIPVSQDLMFDTVKVGTVVFSNNTQDQAVATIVFDGDQSVFNPDLLPEGTKASSGISAQFVSDLISNGKSKTDENGNEYVTILDKTYQLQSPAVVVGPTEVGTPTLEAIVTVTGVDEGGIIDSSTGINITISLPSIPVIGDGVDDYFVYGDEIVLLISENFMFDTLPPNQDLMFGGVKVGTVVFSNNAQGQAVATIVLDGEEYIFDPDLLPPGEPPYADISAEFSCNLVFNGEYDEDEDGNTFVTILDKTYQITLPGDVITHTVTKEADSVDLEDGTITWSVTITGESDTVPPTPIDLAGYLFEDDLSSVGAFVSGSFLVNGVAAVPEATSPVLSYTLPSPSVSPITITFTTAIPDGVLAAGGTVVNTAEVSDNELPIGSDNASVTITGPTVSKTGTADDGFDGQGGYDPTDRTITWAIPVDNQGLTLYDLTITDPLQGGLIFESAVWQRWDEATSTWVDVVGMSWSTEPTNGVYEIGDVDYLGRLVIVSGVPDDADGSVNYRNYYNQASVSWESAGGSTGTGDTGNVGVGIGYDAISKSGTQSDADKANHQITWTINVDLMGQSPTDFVYYDLFVHDAATTNAALMASTNWPSGITIGNPGVTRNNGQMFVAVSSQDSHLTVETLSLDSLGTLVKVSNLRASGTNQVVLKSQVIDPDILAGNDASQTVTNVASLYKGLVYRGRDDASVSFNNLVLAKEMLNRVEVANDHDPLLEINPNNRTTTAANGFHYDYREVIFRLNINAAGLDFGDVVTNLTNGFGTVTVTDTLPTGWEFSAFSGGAMFLIYSANGSAVATTPALNPSTITGFTSSVGTSTATFTFTDLDQPYVILVKAKPTDATFDGYLVGADSHVETNTVNLRTANWNPGVTDTQNVRINTELMDKSIDLSQQYSGILTWRLEYTPFNRPIADGIQDVLPEGIDLRTDSSGELIWIQDGVRNITVHELVPNANGNGGYTVGTELDLTVIQANLVYDNETRTLTFTFPDKTKGYRVSYITDITGQPGKITNSASLIGAEGDGTGTSEDFIITEQHGFATMSRTGFVSIKKTNAAGGVLPGAEFTLYNTDEDGNKTTSRVVRVSNTDGTIRIYGLQPGTYILQETNPPDDYYGPPLEFVIVVAADFATTIDGTSMSITNPYEVVNYLIPLEAGSLTIRKTVQGNGGDPTKLFNFRITFDGATDVYPYTGYGVPNGFIKSGDTFSLAHNQSITITGLPVGATYTIVEADYSSDGYVLTYTGANGTIILDETQLAQFTNTREIGSLTISKTVAGNGGDPNKLFEFTVTFENAPYTYPYVGSGGAADGTITSGDTIYLSHGQSITINDLPADATYTVVEADYAPDGYVLTYTGADGNIVIDETQVAAFTNTRELGSLTIQKTVAGNGGDPDKLFEFTISFGNAPYTYPYVGSGGAIDGIITSGDTIYLSHGQSITINDLPKDATYTIVEADYSADGYITTYTGAEGVIVVDDTQFSGFTNTREIGSLNISKTVVGNGGDPDKLFTFVVTFENAPLTYPYVGSGGAIDGIITSGDTIYLSHGQSITINDLPKDATYTVVETDYSEEGYITTYSGTNGVIVVDETQRAAFTNTRELGSLTIEKTVTGDLADRNRYFTFIVEFSTNEVYYYHGSKAGAIKSGQSVQLKHDEHIVIEGILVGTTYKVTEVEANQGGYGTSYTGTVGLISTTGKTASFVNRRSSVPNTGDDNTAALVKVGLIISVSILLLSSSYYGYLNSKKRKQPVS